MLDGWYCRSIANEAAQAEEEERVQEESRIKKQYKFLKGKIKHLIYVSLNYKSSKPNNRRCLLFC